MLDRKNIFTLMEIIQDILVKENQGVLYKYAQYYMPVKIFLKAKISALLREKSKSQSKTRDNLLTSGKERKESIGRSHNCLL